METHRKELQQTEATSTAALATDYDFLLGEINRTRQRIKEELQQLESNVQLDLNLERKRRTELLAEVEAKNKIACAFLEEKANEIDTSLRQLSRQAMSAITALGTALLVAFIGYKVYVTD